MASSSDGDQSKQPKTKHEDASKNRKHGKKKSKSDARSKKRAGAGKTSESFDDYEDYEEREAVSKADKKVSKDRPGLFAPMTLREVTVRNRIWLPPMCTYSSFARDGRPTPFHYQHYVSRAFGGFGMVIVESTAVAPEGRITPCDLGLWEDGQIDAWRWIVDGIREAGAVPAIQLNHAGRKASTGCFAVGYDGQSVPEEAGGWPTMAPSEIAFGGLRTPRALSVDEIHGLVGAFAAAAGRAVAAGFQAIQIHAAHGYLISQFLDPLSNERDDEYGGDLTGRSRFLVEVVDAVRGAVPEGVPVRAHFGHGLGRRRLGFGPDHRTIQGAEGAWRRCDGRVYRRHHVGSVDSGQAELSGAVLRAGQGQGRYSGDRGGSYHQAEAGGQDSGPWRSRCRGDWPRRIA
ncbi:oxidoreductase, FAD/FMN-binding protein [Bifidobacterium longum subsp. infantis CCUG 52486]|uniref:Oxidoreductase, FAD/FMN-binding protein n=1 Tax=Bifidobacterium longum subsp. infantis CCUG 52486 TaxID=537937 RepID=C5E866_BIFLI|nr:oxidoreductase, FAD/FMN-binding protein [Bifidobacterium longum subsp. infantis CCUG 52486]